MSNPVTDDRISNGVFHVVQEAIWAGWTPQKFKAEVAECWKQALADEAKVAEKVLTS